MDAGGNPAAGQVVAELVVVELRPEAEWRRDAACRDLPTSWWYPERFLHPDEAMAVCARCPAARDCLLYALVNHEQEGVWGGLTYKGRRRLQRELGARYVRCERCARVVLVEGTGAAGSQSYCGDDCRRAARRDRQAQRARARRDTEEELWEAI